MAYEVATALHVPLDVFIVRKIGAPWNEELAIGALASGGVRILNEPLIRELGVGDAELDRITAKEQRELERREHAYRGTRPSPDVRGRIVILVDDGLATGSSMLAAVEAIRAQAPAAIVVATPVASDTACEAVRRVADLCVCLTMPEPLYGIGLSYEDFSQTTDQEVIALLEAAARNTAQTTAR